MCDNGFDDEAARELFDEGVAEENSLGANVVADFPGLRFTPSSLVDLERFGQGEARDGLNRALHDLPDKLDTPACVSVSARSGRILREGPYRIVFRLDNAPSSVVVLGIACWVSNPMVKVWRYLDQTKAEDLIRTNELYFRRVDLLEDKYEATPTFGRYLDEKAAFRHVFPGVSESHSTLSEAHKHCTYACCWRTSPHESWLAWKHYCPDGGGCALQTTDRKLAHLHARLKKTHDVHYRQISYIDHKRDEFQNPGLGEEAFYKAPWFSDERETRMVRFHVEYINVSKGALKADPSLIPECDRIKCDLSTFVETIVFNPFATEEQKTALTKLIQEYNSEHKSTQLPKPRPSAIQRPPVGHRRL